MLPELDEYGWEDAFRLSMPPEVVPGDTCSGASFARQDVAEVIALEAGENDGAPWIGVFLLKDGCYAYLSAWCDYTGWDCQAGGSSAVASTLLDLVRLGLDEEARERLHMPLLHEKYAAALRAAWVREGAALRAAWEREMGR